MPGEYREDRLQTPIGTVLLRARDARLTGLAILPGNAGASRPSAATDSEQVLIMARQQLAEYFAGRRKVFDLPIALPPSPEFTRKVLEALRVVPFGEILTYGDLAALVGSPRASRAVGQVMAGNPLPIILPCHRVVAAGGLTGGYSGGEGVSTKQWLLEFERRIVGE